MKNKFIWFVALVGACVFLSATQLHAAWWEFKDIPVPPGAKEFKKATQDLDGKMVEFTHYTSASSIEEIKEFYRKNLSFKGWEERDILDDLKEVPELAQSSALKEMLGYNLVFEKGDENVVVNIVPPGYLPSGKTRFSIARGKLNLKSDVPEIEIAPAPKRSVVPVFPGATELSYSEMPGTLLVTFAVKTGCEEVNSFYKKSLSGRGFELTEETLPTLIQAEKIAEGKDCPECEKKYAQFGAQGSAASFEVQNAGLKFKNKKDDVITVTTVAVRGLPQQSPTKVMVAYEEKSQ